MNPQRIRGVATTVTGAALIAWLTLLPNTGPIGPGNSGCCEATDIALNTLLFVPLGVGLALLGLRPFAASVVGGALSIAIEVAQLSWVIGRDAAVHDVFSNALGTTLGALMVLHWATRISWWRWISPIVSAGVVLAWVAAAFLIRPSNPRNPYWYSQWQHELGGMVRYPGTILSLTLQGIPIEDGPIARTAAIREQIVASDTLLLTTSVLTGPPFPGRAQLAGVVAGQRTGELVGIWQEDNSIIAFARLQMSSIRLRTAGLRVPDAPPGVPGDTLQIAFERTRDRLRLTVQGGGMAQEQSLRLSPELFWTAFLPFEYLADPGLTWWPLLPAFATFVLLGLALGASPVLLLLACLAALVPGPLLAGTALSAWPVAGVALAGALVGRALASRLRLFAKVEDRRDARR